MRKILIAILLIGSFCVSAQELKFAPDPSGVIDTGDFWNILGNSGTTTSNFIGTTDVAKVRLRYANIPSGFIDGFNTAYGLHALLKVDTAAGATGINNTAAGISALHSNTTGNRNTGFGESSLRLNTTGSDNTAIGLYALRNSIGSGNIAIGAFAGQRGSHTNKFFVSNQDFGATADSLNKQIRNSLMYGAMGGDSSLSDLRINATVQISDGTQSNGDVFTCDANGVGSWQAPAVSGWSLTGNAGTTYPTNYAGTSDAQPFRMQSNAGAWGEITIQNTDIVIATRSGATGSAQIRFYDSDIPFEYMTMTSDDTSATISAPNIRFSQDGNGNIGDIWVNEDGALGTGRWQAPTVTSFENGIDLASGIGRLGGNLTLETTLLEFDGTNQLFAIFDTSVAGKLFRYGDDADGNNRIVLEGTAHRVQFGADTLQLTGIGEGAGKVLTSDAAGNATWQTSPIGYSVYTALLSQSGTDAPTAVVLQNTIGSIVWTRNTTGDYTGTLSGAFTANATVFFTNSPYYILSNMARLDNNSVGLSVSDVSTNTQVDNVSNISIEIRVY